MKALPHEERLSIGFAKIETDLDFLMQCFREVLVSLGQQDIADRLPWIGTDTPGPEGEDFPAFHVKIQPLDRMDGAIRFLQAGHFDDVLQEADPLVKNYVRIITYFIR